MYFHQTLVHAVCQFAHTKLNQLEYFSSCPTAQLSENITKKMNLRPFKPYRVCLEPLNSTNVGDFSGVEFLRALSMLK